MNEHAMPRPSRIEAVCLVMALALIANGVWVVVQPRPILMAYPRALKTRGAQFYIAPEDSPWVGVLSIVFGGGLAFCAWPRR